MAGSLLLEKWVRFGTKRDKKAQIGNEKDQKGTKEHKEERNGIKFEQNKEEFARIVFFEICSFLDLRFTRQRAAFFTCNFL